MKKILILSVGGSAEPIVNAIKTYNPDFVYFFCSSGPKGSALTVDSPGDPCGDKRKGKCPECGHEFYLGNPQGNAIVFQAGLDSTKYEIVAIDDPDDLNDCYLRLLELSREIKERHGEDCQIIANYTGGTKTMSVAIALAGLMTEEWDLSLNIGPRLNLINVKGGDVPVVIDKWRIFCQNQLESAKKSIENFNYSYATYSISEMLSHPLDRGLRNRLLKAHQISQAFNLWDKFHHQKAFELLIPHGARFSSYIIVLKKILGMVKSTGYEMVGDLLNNAERKAHQRYYDDAVARIYRATELFAQIRLEKTYGYKTDNMKLTDLPEVLKQEYRSRVRDGDKLFLGLKEDYELLFKLDDPFGHKFKEREEGILNALTRRNLSIGAHGLIPLSERDYLLVEKILREFILDTSKAIGIDLQIPQLPQYGIL
ncbi:MAG: hypothetical protein DDT23_01320 [candidate division WS2 bacterium]|nr:hypothetical protein [Candidatus Lithacetigena glycinireducens]